VFLVFQESGAADKWRVENSWGDKKGEKGEQCPPFNKNFMILGQQARSSCPSIKMSCFFLTRRKTKNDG